MPERHASHLAHDVVATLNQRQQRRVSSGMYMNMNIALRRFLHNHGNIATEGSPKPGLCPTLNSNDFKGSV